MSETGSTDEFVTFDSWSDDLEGRPVREVLGDLARRLLDSRRVLLTCHLNPDGDAIGSVLALARALGKRGIVSLGLVPGGIPRRFEPFARKSGIERWPPGTAERAGDCLVVLDTSEPGRLGKAEEILRRAGVDSCCIDHHLCDGPGPYDVHLVCRRAPATASLVLGLIDELGIPLDAGLAELLWLGLATDTGWFRFSNTTPFAMGQAARLIAAGADPEELYETIHGNHSLARTRLLGQVLTEARVAHDGRFVWGVIARKRRLELGVELAELDGLIDLVRSVGGARVAALLTEVGDRAYKASLRSRGELDVEGIAREFGGGGHAKAAGFRFAGSLEELERRLDAAVGKALAASESSGRARPGAEPPEDPPRCR